MADGARRQWKSKVVQSILFFALGFLCAGFIALTIAPAIWRRAVFLTRKRIQASVPLTLAEIQADKDRLRAEFAMSTRRLEMSVKSFREKAAEQIVDVTRHREEVKELTAQRDEKAEALAALQTDAAALRATLKQKDEDLDQAARRLAEARGVAEEQQRALDKLERLYDDASFASSTRQIELVARDSEIAKLSEELADLQADRDALQQLLDQARSDAKALGERLEAEHKRSDDLERRIAGMLATVADREEKLDGREKELVALGERIAENERREATLTAELAALQVARQALETELTVAREQAAAQAPRAETDTLAASLAQMSTERERLEERLTTLSRENRRLKEEAATHQRQRAEDWSDEHRQGALLREEMNTLAAEVVRMTAALDDPDSPIARALTIGRKGGEAEGKATSLADRVRALQNAAKA